MRFPYGQTVTVVRGGGVDQYGDPIAGVSFDVELCAVAPRSSSDINDRSRSGVIVGKLVLFPAGTVILPADRFEIGGVAWELDGDAGDWVSPFTGWNPGVEAALKRAAG